MYNISMAEGAHEEIRSYANPKAVYASVGLMFILALVGLSGIFSEDKTVCWSVLPIFDSFCGLSLMDFNASKILHLG
jgi:hypothetical protein